MNEIYLEAKAAYENQPVTYSTEQPDLVVRYEQVLLDGSTLTLTGYPTHYSADPNNLLADETEESYIFAAQEQGPYDSTTTTDSGTGWNMLSTVRYYSRTYNSGTSLGQVNQKKMTRFSYVFEANSNNYKPAKFDIMYMGSDPYNSSAYSRKDITSTQLVMTNYPTTSISWISNYSGSVMGVCYKFTINGNFIPLDHFIIGNAWPV